MQCMSPGEFISQKKLKMKRVGVEFEAMPPAACQKVLSVGGFQESFKKKVVEVVVAEQAGKVN